jgi:rhomboid protease GluP
MAYGLTPQHSTEVNTEGLSEKEAFATAVEVVQELGWSLGFINKDGFVAYTKFSAASQAEEVQVRVATDTLHVKSVCVGNQLVDFGKNEANTEAFAERFKAKKEFLNPEEAIARYHELEHTFSAEEEHVFNQAPLSRRERITNILSLFRPVEGYFITPVLLNLNIAIFIVIAVSGVNILLPDNDSLLLWGANFRPYTLDGEWWRLLSSCFIHIGVIHLLLNMYALVYIGLLLEPYLGRSRFLAAYLITGLLGSAASLFWNELTISAGASGAIFGLYGVFLAMLTTNLIEKTARKAMLTSIGVFVCYNLFYGLKGGIDNAAHIGGLLSGLVVGYAYYPGLLKSRSTKWRYTTISLLSLFAIACTTVIALNTAPGDIGKYEQGMEEFVVLEEKAMSIYHLPEQATDQRYLYEIENNGIPNWELSIQLLEKIDRFDLPVELHERIAKLKEYCALRIQVYQLIAKMIAEETNLHQAELEGYNQQIEAIIAELTTN